MAPTPSEAALPRKDRMVVWVHPQPGTPGKLKPQESLVHALRCAMGMRHIKLSNPHRAQTENEDHENLSLGIGRTYHPLQVSKAGDSLHYFP